VQYLIEQKRNCGFNILESILKEEAAKFIILMDAIRCPRVPSDNFSKQLGRFNDHLAKGIYALIYDFYIGAFGDLHQIIERECHKYYLDGPNGVDWIFRNELLQMREEKIYVDYIESERQHMWLTPKRYYHPEMALYTNYLRPQIVEVAMALWKAGLTKSDALSTLANNWRELQITNEFTWLQLRECNIKTLEDLEKNNLLNTQEELVCTTIIDKWSFPLYSLDIRIIKVDQDKLKDTRDRHYFELYY
jgi:AbiV family abortive infection protein